MKEKSFNIEEVLHIGNKKAKQLRDVRQEFWAYVYDEELISQKAADVAGGFCYCQHYPLRDFVQVSLSEDGCTCGCEDEDFADCECENILSDKARQLENDIDSLMSNMQLLIINFYDVKNKIIEKLFKANAFELAGYHISSDTGNELLYFKGEKYTFHLPMDKSNLDLDIDEVEYLGEIGIVPSDEPVSEYSTLKLEEITRLLENYL